MHQIPEDQWIKDSTMYVWNNAKQPLWQKGYYMTWNFRLNINWIVFYFKIQNKDQ